MKTFRPLLLLALLLTGSAAASAQTGRLYRSEGIPFDNRHHAVVGGNPANSSQYIRADFTPEAVDGATIWLGQTFELPYVWSEGRTALHLESVGQAYSLFLNGTHIATSTDGFTPVEYDLTEAVKQGENHLRIALRADGRDDLQQGFSLTGPRFEGSYLVNRQRRTIADYRIALVPDSLRRFGVLELDLIIRNDYNYDETVNPAFDIYSPEGKLMEYSDHPVVLAGHSQDTIRLRPLIYHTNDHKWGDGKGPLYSVMLFTKRDGKMWEYLPLKVGFSDMEYRDGQWYRFGAPYTLREAPCDAAADRTATKKQMESLRKSGINTLRPSRPQPAWYYDLADELGLCVIDCAAISAPDRRDDRRIGGTPANDPALADEFVERVKAMYYRSRNHTCIIGFSLGNPSGNGYAMYKAYEWLKSAEPVRPVFYDDARGEWNSD